MEIECMNTRLLIHHSISGKDNQSGLTYPVLDPSQEQSRRLQRNVRRLGPKNDKTGSAMSSTWPCQRRRARGCQRRPRVAERLCHKTQDTEMGRPWSHYETGAVL